MKSAVSQLHFINVDATKAQKKSSSLYSNVNVNLQIQQNEYPFHAHLISNNLIFTLKHFMITALSFHPFHLLTHIHIRGKICAQHHTIICKVEQEKHEIISFIALTDGLSV
jgi:hypothetical protein